VYPIPHGLASIPASDAPGKEASTLTLKGWPWSAPALAGRIGDRYERTGVPFRQARLRRHRGWALAYGTITLRAAIAVLSWLERRSWPPRSCAAFG
jgi:hypothetical protein